MTNSSSEYQLNRKDVKDAIEHFANLMEMGEEAESLKGTWFESMKPLVKAANVLPAEFCQFLTWVAVENTNEKGALNSVEYLAMAKDKMGSLVKNFDSLWHIWRAKRKVAGVMKRQAVKASVAPMPADVADWLLVEPGVNCPLAGWDNAQQKLNAAKVCWYGFGGEEQANPSIDFEEKFQGSLLNLGITKQASDHE